MQYSLVIIDMQHTFDAANFSWVRKGCREAIRQAIADKAPIILVEYEGYKGTVKSLTDVISKARYKHKFVVTKNDDDGADEVFDALVDNKLPRRKIKVCGVNTDCCVYATVRGLVKRHKLKNNIEVIANACGSDGGHAEGLEDIKDLGVKIVKLTIDKSL